MRWPKQKPPPNWRSTHFIESYALKYEKAADCLGKI